MWGCTRVAQPRAIPHFLADFTLLDHQTSPEKVMSTEIVTKEEFLHLKEELLTEIRVVLEENLPSSLDDRKWLRSTEVKKLLSISSGTLQNLRVNGTLPYTRVNRIIYYNKEEIDALLEKNTTRCGGFP
jgi:hypothetical protein